VRLRTDDVVLHGKGYMDRALAHERGFANSGTAARIAEIRAAGQRHRIDILAHGFDDPDTAYRVEAAAIDLLGRAALTNLTRGWGSVEYGSRSLRELDIHYGAKPVILSDPVILIRINQLFKHGMTPEALYDATRGIWKLGERRHKAKYALAVYEDRIEAPLLLSIDGGTVEREFPRLVVEYQHVPAYRGRSGRNEYVRVEPDQPEHVEIGRVYVMDGEALNPMPEWQVEAINDQLESMCLEDWRGRDEAARVSAAEWRYARAAE